VQLGGGTMYQLYYVPTYSTKEMLFGEYDTLKEAQETGKLLVQCSYRIAEINPPASPNTNPSTSHR
jgi:hypothetical protein